MKFGTIKSIANYLGIGWDTVKDLQKDYLKRVYTSIDYKSLRYISMDEFSIKKGHEYMTQFTNHSMKEQLRLFWSKNNRKEGAQFLVWWFADAVRSGIRHLAEAGKTILRHYEGLLSYFDHKISNGITEGINNKIKTLKRQAYGFRDMEYFKLRLYHLHNQGYSLTG